MSLSRPEINLRRLLAKCELLCKTEVDERFPKYVNRLDEMLLELKSTSDPTSPVLKTYQQRINAIKKLLGIDIAVSSEENYQDMRNDLLNVRHRTVQRSDDLDDILKYNENIQEKATEDMLYLAKSLKEQSELANKVIRKDIEVLSRSSVLSDQNKIKLELESEKLAEHSKRACKCWMWIMLLVVMIVFINMVLFMKVMKKKY